MRQRLALLIVAVAATAPAVLAAGPASAEPPQPVLYAAGTPIYAGVVYSGSVGNVEAVVER